MTQLSNDCFANDGALMPLNDALALLEERLTIVVASEAVSLDGALGRIIAEPVRAGRDVPPADNSAVDGYAVFFDDLAVDGETRLPVRGRAAAGHPLGQAAERGTAVRIFTGAVMPAGPDTVLMQEDCRLEGDHVIILPGIKRGANRRLIGEDVRAGATVLPAGIRLRPQDLGLAAAVGRRTLTVSAALPVALFSTGDELAEPGEALRPGATYDSNRFTVSALLRSQGCRVTDLGILPDRPEAVRQALAAAADGHHLIITSGGVSVGEEDHVKQAVESLGHLHAWRLAIKPGRPIALGQVGRIPFVGLPGNPVAVVVTFLNLVRPMLLRMMGGRDLSPPHYRVQAAFDYKKKKNRREWVRARLEPGGNGQWQAVKFPRDGAGILSSLVETDGLVELPEDMTRLEAGSFVDFLPYREVLT